MIIFPAIDLYDGKAVRLVKGDYTQMTVYNDSPLAVTKDFVSCGAEYIHMVDLEGAKDGTTPNLHVVSSVAKKTSLHVEIGGGIRNIDTVKRYFDAGVDRVIVGTAAITNRSFLKEAVNCFGERIAVGADVKDGYIAIKGWLEKSAIRLEEFITDMCDIGVKNIICTDISRDGMMQGTNTELYKELVHKYQIQLTASGGVSSMEDVISLRKMDIYGAIIGKAYYTGAIDLKKAIEVAR